MSLASVSYYNEAVSSENPRRFVSREQREFIVESTKHFQKENFWCLLKKIFSIDKCLSFLQSAPPPSSRNQKYLQQLHKNVALNSVIEPCLNTNTTTVVPSSAFTSRVNFDLSTQKLNLNNFLMLLLCACIPAGSSVPPPTKLMLCLPCPAPVKPGEIFGSNNRCESFPFGVPRKSDDCGGSQASRKGKYLPPPAKRHCSGNCLHVCDLKPVTLCKADKGCPCVAHCFESHPECRSY